jgi:hypothetical protein
LGEALVWLRERESKRKRGHTYIVVVFASFFISNFNLIKSETEPDTKGMDEYFVEDHNDALLHISRNGQVLVALVNIVGSVGNSMPA